LIEKPKPIRTDPEVRHKYHSTAGTAVTASIITVSVGGSNDDKDGEKN